VKSRIAIAFTSLLVLAFVCTLGCVQESETDNKDEGESNEGPAPKVEPPQPDSACVQECRTICGDDEAADVAKLEGHFRTKLRADLAKAAKAGRDVAGNKGKERPKRPKGKAVNAAPNPLKNLPMKGAKDPKVVILESSDFQ
jgi:hypothetical protein